MTDKMDEENIQLISNINNVDKTNIPPWALVVLDSVKSILNVLNNIKSMTDKIDELESLAIVSKTTSDLLSTELEASKKKIEELVKKMDDQEQRSRNQCLLFHGIAERDGEDTDKQVIEICKNHLNIDLDINTLARSHRLGPRKHIGRNTRSKPEKPRPITTESDKKSSQLKNI